MSSGNKADRHFRRVRRRSRDTALAMRWEYRTKFDLQQEMCDIFSIASPVALIEGSHQSYCGYYNSGFGMVCRRLTHETFSAEILTKGLTNCLVSDLARFSIRAGYCICFV